MNELHKKIKQIENRNLVNKKYLVSEDVDLSLQQFCMRNELKISEVLALAVVELIEKYEGGQGLKK